MPKLIGPGEIIESMKPLIQEARDKNKWLRSAYDGSVFSPDEMDRHHAEGRYLWGPVNWRLIDPNYHAQVLADKALAAKREHEHFCERMATYNNQHQTGTTTP